MNEVELMRVRIALVMAAVLLMAPTASAHGANTFAFIMRNNSVQPDEASVQQNDTLIFYNVVDRNRTLNFTTEGKNGTIEWECETGPSNSLTTDDECRVWLNPEYYKPTILEIQIFNNGSLWRIVNVTVQLDNHTENGPPDGGFSLPGGGQEPSESSDDVGFENFLLIGAIVSFVAAASIWVMRNNAREDSNNVAKEEKVE
tara:strand:+ start:1983 stop:2585 length:603 start_codon:yes stop_codon:yes gene_type:complete